MSFCVLGAGRGSAELIDFLQETQGGDVVVLDDRLGLPDVCGAPVVGTLAEAAAYAGRGHALLSGIANSKVMGLRLQIAARTGLPIQAWASFVHPGARVSKHARIEPGSVVYPGACIALQAHIGAHALIYYNAVVHHDVVIGDGVILCAGVMIAGNARVGAGSYLGVGAVVRDGVIIGARALVGMGAVVTRDVPEDAVVKGVPARA